MVTLSGTGLTDEMTITHNGGECVIVSANRNEVICLMMPSVSRKNFPMYIMGHMH